MNYWRTNPKCVLVAIVALLFICSIMPSSAANWIWSTPQDPFMAVISPLTKQLHRLSISIRPPHDKRFSVDSDLLKERDELYSYNLILQQQLERANDRIFQLGAVRKKSVLGQSTGLLFASVVYTNTNLPHSTLTIDKGSFHGVATGQAVVLRESLIGRVSHVGHNAATVTLITQPKMHLDVHLVPGESTTGTSVTVTQVLFDDDINAFVTIMDASEHNSIQIGHAAILVDVRWPLQAQKFVVGYVASMEPQPDHPLLQKRVVIEPVVDMNRLAEVLVVINPILD